MSVLPTVRVVSMAAPGGFVIINADDLRDHHELWDADERDPEALDHSADDASAEPLPLCVVKGPRGKWYVKRGPMKVGGKNAFESDGFESREEALDALQQISDRHAPEVEA